MTELVLSLRKRFLVPLVLLGGALLWLLMCHVHYSSYWFGTIYRVQTMDFNLLHHTLPITLSRLVLAGNDEEIQKVLDSTYGIFGLVVTNASGSTVLYRTSRVYHRESWQSLLSPEALGRLPEPYDLLTDPPPLASVYRHASPRAALADKSGSPPQGRVLGRVYYVRPVPPTFVEDLRGFLSSGPWQLSGARRGYLYISLISLVFVLAVLLLVLWRKRGLELKQQQLCHIEKDLQVKQKALDRLTIELMAQKQRKDWLEQEAESAYRRSLALREALERLRQCLRSGPPSPGGGAGVSLRQAGSLGQSSALLEEIEALVPELTNNALTLRTQAGVLQEHCLELEQRQAEMRRILEQAYQGGQTGAANVLRFRAK